jgi:uncharacterized protein YeaO (DUF488 family)
MRMNGLSTFRIGGEAPSEQAPKGALRLGTVRYLPRGMSVAERKKRNLFDVWLPLLAPSAELFGTVKPGAFDDKSWERFAARYRKEFAASAEKREALKLVALLARQGQVSLGCYCADEKRCHRSLLKALVEETAKEI